MKPNNLSEFHHINSLVIFLTYINTISALTCRAETYSYVLILFPYPILTKASNE